LALQYWVFATKWSIASGGANNRPTGSHEHDPQVGGVWKMTIDKSLRVKAGAISNRNVLTRAERIAKLKESERWKEGDTVLGLPKVRVLKLALKKKKKAAKAEEEGAEGAAGATPAAGGAAAAKGGAAKK
jgi:small basic protein (TIGR04137 family)